MPDKFEWNDLLVNEYAGYLSEQIKIYKASGIPEILQRFKESKNPTKKEWDILTFISAKEPNKCWTLRQDGCYSYYNNQTAETGYTLNEMLYDSVFSIKTSDLIIKSVRRNSDGEMFTIGNELKHPTDYTRDSRITTILIEDNNCFLMGDNGEWSSSLMYAKKVQSHIFTTADGIDIHLNDFYWYVTKDFNVFRDFCNAMTGGKVVAHSRVGDVFFSTEQAAIKYVNEKKPSPKLFTTEDKVDIFDGDNFWKVNEGNYEITSENQNTIFRYGKITYKYFSTESAAVAYIHENKPIYSIKDFREIIRAFEERIASKTDNHV